MYPHGQTAELLAAGSVTDPYSGETVEKDWSNPVTVETWTGIAVAPGPRSDTEEVGRSPVFSGLVLYGVPVDSAVTAHSRVRLHGVVYEVDGDPGDFVNPFTGVNKGLVVNLEKVSG